MGEVDKILNRSSNRIRKLIQEVIRDKNLIKTGDLIKSIDVSVKESNGDIRFHIGAIYYYTYLDDGTRYIKSYDITKDVVDSTEFEKILEDTLSSIMEEKL